VYFRFLPPNDYHFHDIKIDKFLHAIVDVIEKFDPGFVVGLMDLRGGEGGRWREMEREGEKGKEEEARGETEREDVEKRE
jgi:hypothetical protein